MNQPLFVAVAGFAGIWFWLWAIVDVAIGPRNRFRFGSRKGWLPVVIFAPVAGGLIYLVTGRYVPAPPESLADSEPRPDEASPDHSSGDDPCS